MYFSNYLLFRQIESAKFETKTVKNSFVDEYACDITWCEHPVQVAMANVRVSGRYCVAGGPGIWPWKLLEYLCTFFQKMNQCEGSWQISSEDTGFIFLLPLTQYCVRCTSNPAATGACAGRVPGVPEPPFSW